jgi:hypothetical protein
VSCRAGHGALLFENEQNEDCGELRSKIAGFYGRVRFPVGRKRDPMERMLVCGETLSEQISFRTDVL